VIIFEQSAEVLEKRLGFHVQEYGLRQVFARLPDHPALTGIAPENLVYWNGRATLTPPRLKYEFDKYKTPMVEWCGLTVSHPWRCGNHGNVASVLIEKPGRGDFLPIVDGGFSLQYAPLMEYREGNGLIVFCQLDVTGRSQADPAAERIGRNLLEYVDRFKAAPIRKAAYAGEPAGKAYLEKVGIAAEPYAGGKLEADQVLIIGPGGGKALETSAPAVAEFVKAGGHVLAIGLDQDEAAFIAPKLSTKKSEFITTTFSPPPMISSLAGIGPADLGNRDPRDLPLITAGGTVIGNGVLCTASDSRIVFYQLVPWHFDYEKQYNLKRTYRRGSYAIVRILANAGVAAQTPLLSRISTPLPAAKLEPRWLDGLYIDKPEEWDDPYRFFCW
jgi:hypothetical protein